MADRDRLPIYSFRARNSEELQSTIVLTIAIAREASSKLVKTRTTSSLPSLSFDISIWIGDRCPRLMMVIIAPLSNSGDWTESEPAEPR
jgi:hypothetical protein